MLCRKIMATISEWFHIFIKDHGTYIVTEKSLMNKLYSSFNKYFCYYMYMYTMHILLIVRMLYTALYMVKGQFILSLSCCLFQMTWRNSYDWSLLPNVIQENILSLNQVTFADPNWLIINLSHEMMFYETEWQYWSSNSVVNNRI
jgi:Golgi nucleoside diphosphatase